jgi:hypothetical protein
MKCQPLETGRQVDRYPGRFPPSVLDRNGLEILPRAECLRLLATRPVGRVGVSRHALPAILPVTYRMLGEDIVFATGTGSSLSPAPMTM